MTTQPTTTEIARARDVVARTDESHRHDLAEIKAVLTETMLKIGSLRERMTTVEDESLTFDMHQSLSWIYQLTGELISDHECEYGWALDALAKAEVPG